MMMMNRSFPLVAVVLQLLALQLLQLPHAVVQAQQLGPFTGAFPRPSGIVAVEEPCLAESEAVDNCNLLLSDAQQETCNTCIVTLIESLITPSIVRCGEDLEFFGCSLIESYCTNQCGSCFDEVQAIFNCAYTSQLCNNPEVAAASGYESCNAGVCDSFECGITESPTVSPTEGPTPEPTDPPTDSGSGRGGIRCFSTHNTVQVQDKGEVLMKDLQVGDKVRVMHSPQDSIKYEPVYSFAHYNLDQKAQFVQIYSSKDSKNPLELSQDHIVYVLNNKLTAIRADQVRIGDTLVRMEMEEDGDGVTTTTNTVTVTKLSKVTRNGFMAPLTPSGNIVVSNIVASNSVSLEHYLPTQIQDLLQYYLPFLDHDQVFYYWLSPYRIMCLGISKTFGSNPNRNSEGVLQWLWMGTTIAETADQLPFVLQFFAIGLPLLVVLGIFNILEVLFTPFLAPMGVVALVIGASAMMSHRRGRQNTNMSKVKSV